MIHVDVICFNCHVACREVHHMCVLLGYGADAICPYLVFETMNTLKAEGVISSSFTEKDIFEVSCGKFFAKHRRHCCKYLAALSLSLSVIINIIIIINK